MLKMEDRLSVTIAEAVATAFTNVVLPALVSAIGGKKPAGASKAGDTEQLKRDTAYIKLQESIFSFAQSKGGDPAEALKELLVP